MKKPVKEWKYRLALLAAIVIPGSGYVVLGLYSRSLQMLFFMGFFGFITYNLTGPDISPVGRFAGAFAVWVLSVLDVRRAVIGIRGYG